MWRVESGKTDGDRQVWRGRVEGEGVQGQVWRGRCIVAGVEADQ